MVPGVRAGGFLFLSVIRGREPGSGRFPTDPLEQARLALRNLAAVLGASGGTLADVVKVTLYLGDLRHRDAFHLAWCEAFPMDPPARIAVGVADPNAAPGGGALFALDVIALAR
jgi:2-iminobutanoate/2-iminopropanoate deaminase